MSKTIFKRQSIWLSIITLSLMACSKAPEPEKNTQTEAQTQVASENQASENQERYVVVTDASNPPFEFRDKNGHVVGFDADLIKAIAKQQGFQVDIVSQPWSGIFDSLNNGRDIIAAPVAITEERKEIMSYMTPYIYATRTAFMLEDNAKKLGVKSFADVGNVVVATKEKTTNEDALKKHFGENNKNIQGESTQYMAYKKMLAGEADAVFGDTTVIRHYIASNPENSKLKFAEFVQPNMKVWSGFTVRKGNTELLEKLNAGLAAVRADGTYAKLANKWLDEKSAKTAIEMVAPENP